MATIQFSYPSITGTQATQKDDFIFDSNDGFFSYTDSAGSAPKVFTPSKMFVISNKLYIQHSTTTTANVYIVFNLETDANANPITTNNTTYINSIISDQLERIKDSAPTYLKIPCDITHKYTNNNQNIFSTDHIFEFPGKIKVKSAANFGASAAPNSPSNNSDISCTPLSFATDEIICGDATIDQQNITQTNIVKFENYSAYGITFGVIILAVSLFWLLLQAFLGRFDAVAGILGWADTKQILFTSIFAILIIISSAMFITYGVQIGQETSDKRTAALPYSLSSAITFLVLAATMIIYKIKYPSE
jgi:hypothetical protein